MGHGQTHQFRFVAAPPDLATYLNSFYILETSVERFEDVLPAYSGQLLLVPQGGGWMQFEDGSRDDGEDVYFQAPLSKAYPFVITGPARMIGASLTFHGWAALTGIAVNECGDRFLPGEAGLGKELAARAQALVEDLRAGTTDEDTAIGRLADILREGITPLKPEHRQVLTATYDWLSSSFNPPIGELVDALPYAERQLQRLILRFFGLPPSRLKRRYRAVRAASILAMPELSDALRDELREAFYDQAHMIREIRHFTGRTPRAISASARSIVGETLGEEGYGAVDLFGGGEAQQLGRKP
jgi:AraC-like DNA-binding protein